MGRVMGRIGHLTAVAVAKASLKGLYPDGGGLYLQVTGNGARSWVYRYMLGGKAREMGLGSYRDVSLAEARKKAAECRLVRSSGSDPIEARNGLRDLRKLETAKTVTFAFCAEAYIEANKLGWRSKKHADQWRSTLGTYAYPVLGTLPVQDVDTALVMKIIEPLWNAKTETASRLRGRIETVLDWAKTRDFRRGDNPARWRGHIQTLLPPRRKIAKTIHHPALKFTNIRPFLSKLRNQEGTAARALELLIFTATRTSEVLGARWEEMDLDQGVWTIPARRIKAGKEHRIPLSLPVRQLLNDIATENDPKNVREASYIFSGGKAGQPLSNMALLALLKRMGRSDITAHGFRSTFRDWAAEETDYPREVAEMALAHTVGDKVEAAYRRGDLFAKRVGLMADWASYCR
jgi:integrase